MTKVEEILAPLWSDINGEDTFPKVRPLLAHYTSISTLELILKNNNIWFSNPLFMNDSEEISFGMLEGNKCINKHEDVLRKACKTEFAYNSFTDAYEKLYLEFSRKHVLDVYALCLSEHDESNTDGQLSMWRGYGGNGSGAALVIDSAKLEYNEDSPFIVASVTYASAEERRHWLFDKIIQFSNLISSEDLSNDEMRLAAYELFERIKIFSIFTKHSGFKDEKEWRIVYLKERDKENILTSMIGYSIGGNGIEPKLKFEMAHIAGFNAEDFSLNKLVHTILLGPTISSPLAEASVKKMLETLDRQEFVDRISTSTIPYRAIKP